MHELDELRRYCAAFPIDDESNVWLPSALLRSQMANMFRDPSNPPHLAKEFMPFYQTEDEDDEDPGQMLMRNWSKW